MRPLGLLACAALLSLVAAPSSAAKRPPRPVIASHGVKVKAGYVGACPRRDRACGVPDVFVTTEPVPVHPGGFLRINTKQRVRRLWMDLDCPHRRVKSHENRVWLFEVPEQGCTVGELLLTYRRLEVTYTFNLERHRHCAPDGSERVAENEFVRVYSSEGVDDGEPETVFSACRFDSGKTFNMGRDYCGDAYYGCDFLEHVRLADEKVAYVTGHYNGRYGPDRYSSLKVLDTATWQVEREITTQESPYAVAKRVFTAVVLKVNGSVAWILDRADYAGGVYSQTYEVWKADAGGSGQLDSDPNINPSWLTLSESVLEWRLESGEVRAATLD